METLAEASNWTQEAQHFQSSENLKDAANCVLQDLGHFGKKTYI